MSKPYVEGMRVVAISHSDDDTTYIFGYGTYEGNFLPPFVDMDEEMRLFKEDYPNIRAANPDANLPEQPDEEKLKLIIQFTMANPRIKLDNGKTVWGYECWWGDLNGFQNSPHGQKKIVEVDIDAEREKARLAEN